MVDGRFRPSASAIAFPNLVVEMHGTRFASQSDAARVMHAQRRDIGRISPDVRDVLLEPGALVRFHQSDIQHAVGAIGLRGKWQVRARCAEVEDLDQQVLAGKLEVVESDLARHGCGLMQHALEHFKGGVESGRAAVQLVDIAGPTGVDLRRSGSREAPTPTLSRNRCVPHGPRATPRSRGCSDACAHPAINVSRGIPLSPR